MKTRVKLSALAMATIIPTAYAGTTNANFRATASLNGACTMSVDNISFGAITPALTGTATATSAIKYKCSKEIAYRISITPGEDSVYERTMKGSKGEYLAR